MTALADLLREPGWSEHAVDRPDGTRLHVGVLGSGPPVVLVHGYGASIAQWSVVAPALVAAGRTVIAYDHRAHGRSTVGRDGLTGPALFDDLVAVADAHDVGDATIVGHSMGTFVAMGAMANPALRARVAGVVLISPETGDVFRGARTAQILAPLARAGALSRLCRSRVVGTRIACQAVGPATSDAVVEATRRMLVATPAGTGPLIGMMARESVAAALPALDRPLTVIWGTADTTTPRWHADLIAERAPQARLLTLDRVGHMVPWEAHDIVVRETLAVGAGER